MTLPPPSPTLATIQWWDELTEMTEEGRAQFQSRVRTVEIQIDGFYCGHCPDLATSRLNSFLAIELLSRTTLQKAVLKIKYTPEVPNVTIRQFQAAKDQSGFD
jgi:P-type Cu+ transporter